MSAPTNGAEALSPSLSLADQVLHVAQRLENAGLAYGQGTLHAFDEAAWLVLWAAQRPLDTDLNLSPALTAPELLRLEALLTQRIEQRLPTAYLTGEAWLQGVPFHIDQRSIVPRSLIAEVLASGWIDDALGQEPQHVLDMCCGNGSLAILSAMAWPNAHIVGADISPEALALAQLNAQRHGMTSRIEWLRSDGWAEVTGCFDLVLCNPPYVSDARMHALPPEFLAEPDLALRGGADGMNFIRPLMKAMSNHLNPGGWLVLEVGHEREGFEQTFAHLQPIWLSTAQETDAVLALSREDLLTMTTEVDHLTQAQTA